MFVFFIFKNLTNGKKLWLRNNISTICSQLVDTIIVNTIFLYLGLNLEWSTIIEIIIASYIFKVLIAMLDTPVYIGVKYIRRYVN